MRTNAKPTTNAPTNLSERFSQIRRYTEELLCRLSPEDACVQSMPDASPAKWHAAHTSWFFETFVLKEYETNYTAFQDSYEALFNSYYNTIGQQFARPRRGLITRPDLTTIKNYRENIDERVLNIINKSSDPKVNHLLELGLNHEQQHQELIVMDIKHLFSINPTNPIFCDEKSPSYPKSISRWIEFEGGLFEFGHDSTSFHFDNEAPMHRRFLENYRMHSQLVTNGEFLSFIDDKGYEDPLLWLSDGWAWVQEEQIKRPLYWTYQDEAWFEFTLSGLVPLVVDHPICHINYYEATAYANWANARLPTEFEWELAASSQILSSQPIRFHAAPGAGENNLDDLHGSVWQWTSSSYLPYPRYSPSPGAIGEYNGKFMSNQNVLRGSSCCTPKNHSRNTYRNFFYPRQRWAFSGLRLADDSN